MAAGLAMILAAPAAAQVLVVQPPPEDLPFDRPESWAMAYFAAATLLSGLETPATRRPGEVSVGIELGWLPSLDATQRHVGFNGTEDVDLNKTPVMPRPRVSIGLPGRLTLIVAGIPPVRFLGLKPALLALGLERPVVEREAWTVGLRGYGQIGHVTGAYTCPQDVLGFEPGSPENPGGCQAASADVAKLRYVGGEVLVAARVGRERKWSPHAALGVTYMDVGFQVDALTFGYIDRTSYLSHGVAISGSLGASYRLSPRMTASLDAFYSPLAVRRVVGAPARNDGLFNVRALVTYKLR